TPDLLWVRLQTIWSDSSSSADSVAGSADQSTDSRIVQLRNSIQYTLENPVVGLGVGNFPVYNGERVHRPDAWLGTHNTFTQLSSESGIPGLALFLFLLGTVVSHAVSILRDSTREDMHFLARATIISVVAFVIGGFFAHIAYEYLFYYIAAISAAMWTISHDGTISPQAALNVRRVNREVRARGVQTL
ncbi:MAG: O-antigen ligase family protein, partial [Candidatus Acidiferrales bacterium]